MLNFNSNFQVQSTVDQRVYTFFNIQFEDSGSTTFAYVSFARPHQVKTIRWSTLSGRAGLESALKAAHLEIV